MTLTDEQRAERDRRQWAQGRRVASLRALHGLLQKDLAQCLGYDRSHISALERGRRRLPERDARKLADLLQTTPRHLLEGEQ